jgi:hypothetical protein
MCVCARVRVYSKPSIIRISEAKGDPKRQFRTRINGTFNDIRSAYKNK